jgi:hypothetical protein
MADRALTTEQTDIAAAAGVPETALEPERLLPPETSGIIGEIESRRNATAQEIGRRAGRAVAAVSELPQLARQLPRRIEDVRWQVRDRLRIIRQQSPGQTTNRIEEMREAAASRIEALRSRAQERLQLLRNRADRLQRERPVELIAGAFGAAFLLGTALRIWRSNSD